MLEGALDLNGFDAELSGTDHLVADEGVSDQAADGMDSMGQEEDGAHDCEREGKGDDHQDDAADTKRRLRLRATGIEDGFDAGYDAADEADDMGEAVGVTEDAIEDAATHQGDEAF